tara:strand:- start:4550 stop:4906 length:357 start_codon:yes stop_codon:yes gene_type:complete
MRLIFVYNANSGKLNSVMDSVHKIISPNTYNCNLCALTFGRFNEREEWKVYRDASDVKMEFYHKDEFLKQFRSKWLSKFDFPVILSEENNEFQIFISSERLNEIQDVSELINTIKALS